MCYYESNTGVLYTLWDSREYKKEREIAHRWAVCEVRFPCVVAHTPLPSPHTRAHTRPHTRAPTLRPKIEILLSTLNISF